MSLLKLCSLILFIVSFVNAQVYPVSIDPSGPCLGFPGLQININNGHLSGCVGGTWALLGGTGSMVYPGVGIGTSTGSAWAASKGFVTTLGSPGLDTNIASEKSIRSAITTAITPAGSTGAIQTNAGSGALGDSGCIATAGTINCTSYTSTGPMTITGLHASTTDCGTVATNNGCLFFNTSNLNRISRKDSSAIVHPIETFHVCIIDNDTQSATALVAANFSGRCDIPETATITEVDAFGGTGIIGGTIAYTGTGSINIQKYTPNGGSTTTILSAALATVAGQACALTITGGTCANGLTSSSTVTISNATLSKGDIIQVSAATPDTTQTWYHVTIIYSY